MEVQISIPQSFDRFCEARTQLAFKNLYEKLFKILNRTGLKNSIDQFVSDGPPVVVVNENVRSVEE